MADFSFLSGSSGDGKAVEELLSVAKDQVVLERVAAINCSGFTDSVLPTHLETRFHKLKSFPTSTSSSSSSLSAVYSPKPNLKTTRFDEGKETTPKPRTETESGSYSNKNGSSRTKSSRVTRDDTLSPPKKNPGGEMEKTPEPFTKTSSSFVLKTQSNSVSDSEMNSVERKRGFHTKLFQNDIFSHSKKNPESKMDKTKKSPTGSASVSPPSQRSGCFWWSPRGASSKKMCGKENKTSVRMGIDWEKMEDELLSDMNGNFSAAKQRELLKKAMKVEKKVNRDAEKLAKWSKQVSS